MAITAAQLNVKIATQGAAEAKRDIASVGDSVERAGASSRVVGGVFMAASAAIGGAFAYGVTEAISFGEAMANVNSIAQVTTAELEKMAQQVIQISSETGQSAETLAMGLYEINSSGFAGADGMHILEVSANAANAGLTTTAVSAKAITAVLNAYGMSAEEAGHVSDVLFQTVNDGVITFEQLSANMGNTLPMASALGVSIEELGAAYANMTLAGVPAAQAETQIASLMRSALNPTTALTEATQAYGYESVEALIAAEGMVGYLDMLTQASGGSTEQMYELLGTQEAVNAALLLGGENLAAYNEEVARMEASSEGLGATQKALAKQMESTAFSLRLLKTNIQAAAIAIGTQLEPAIRFVAEGLTGLIKGFLDLSPAVQRVIGVVAGITGILAAAAGAWALFGDEIALAGRYFLRLLNPLRLIGMALGFLLSPLGLVVAAIAALGLAWHNNWLGIGDIADRIVGRLQGVFRFITQAIGRFREAWDYVSIPFAKIDDIVSRTANRINRAIGRLTKPLASVHESLTSGLGALDGALAPVVDTAEAVANALGTVEDALPDHSTINAVNDSFANLLGTAQQLSDPLTEMLSPIGEGWDRGIEIMDRINGVARSAAGGLNNITTAARWLHDSMEQLTDPLGFF